MQESAVTLDGARRVISPVFTVIATQNPVEFEGTYPLPEAQRDRFLLKVRITYPAMSEEREMLDAYAAGNRLHQEGVASLQPMMSTDDLLLTRRVVQTVRVEQHLLHYILKIVTATREEESIELGAGPRATIALLETAKSLAVLRGRDFITPDDIKELAPAVLNHRVTLSPEAEMEGTTLDEIVVRIFERTEVPR
jgi:MoxR-like ATPase